MYVILCRFAFQITSSQPGGGGGVEGSTRFVRKTEGASNVFFTYFDYFLGGKYKLGG